jgi:hypothetical protein
MRRQALITTDMRTRQNERAAYVTTGCIGIVLRTHWNHAAIVLSISVQAQLCIDVA